MLLLYNNLLDTATLTASSEATGFPANNLKNPFRSKCWKTAGTIPGVAQLVVDHGSAKTVDAIALTGYDWSTAPGKLVVEFNDTDAWTNPAATEILTWVSPTTPGGNKGSIIQKLSATRTYRYNRLRVAAASSVGMTYAASGSSGILVPDHGDIDFGTADFFLYWEGSIPNYKPSAAMRPFTKFESGTGRWYLQLNTSGKWSMVIADDIGTMVNANMTVVPTLTDGDTVGLLFSVVRETASGEGSVSLYINGALFDTVAIPAGTPPTASGSAALNIMGRGDSGIRYASTTVKAIVGNCAPTEADALAIYGGEIPYALQYGSQTAIYTSNFSAGVDGWTAANGTATGNIDTIGGENDWMSFTVNTANSSHAAIKTIGTAYKRYRISFKYYLPSTNSHVDGIKLMLSSGTAVGTGILTTKDAATAVSVECTMGVTGSIGIYGYDGSAVFFEDPGGDDLFYIKEVEIKEIGATLALGPEGITATDWQDSSSNNLDATYPATGYTVNGLADWSLGRLFLGEYFEPERNYSYGYQEAITDPSIISQTIGGQRHADELEHYRTFEASGQLFSQAQWVLFQEMINTVGIRKPLFIALDYDDDSEERTLYGHFTGLPSITRDVPNLWSYSFTVEEDR
jgi:hypothetical protein